LVTAFVGSITYYLIYRNNYLIVESGFQFDPRVISFLIRERDVFFKALTSVFLILFILLFLFGVYSSHKIAGPLHAFRREMRKLIKGLYDTKFRLRRMDELKFLEKPFNQLIDFLNKREVARKENQNNIIVKLRRSLNLVNKTRDRAKILQLLNKIDEYNAKL